MQHDSPPDGRATLTAQQRAAAVWMDTSSQSTDTAMDTTSTAALTHLPGSSVFSTAHSSPLRSVPSSVPHTPMHSSVRSSIFPIAQAKRVSDGTSSSLTNSSSHTSPAQPAPTSAASTTSSGSAAQPQDRPQSRARKSQSRSSVKKPRSKKPKRDEVEDAVADSDHTVLELDRSTSLLCFLVTEQQRKERLANAEANATPGNKRKFAYVRSKQPMHGYVCMREVEAKMLRNLPQYRSRDSQSFRSSIRQAFEKLHYWPLEAIRPEVDLLKENDVLKMNAPSTCVYPINHIINFLTFENDPTGSLERWSKQLEQRWAEWMETNGYELSTDSSAETSSGAVSDAGHPPPPGKAKLKPKPRARKQAHPRRAARVAEDEEEADEEHEESEDESMGKAQSNPRSSPSSLAARRNVQPPPLQQHSAPQLLVDAAHKAQHRQHQGFGAPAHADPARYTYHDSGSYGQHAQSTQHHHHTSHAHHEHGFHPHAPHAQAYAASSLMGHRRQGSSAEDMRDHHSHARPTPASSRALQFVPSSHQLSHPAPFNFHSPPIAAAAAAAAGYGSIGHNDPFGHAQGHYMQPLRPLIPVQIRQPITLVLSPTSLASASDLRHSPDLMSPVSPPSLPHHAYLSLSKGRTSPSDFLLKSPLADALQQPPPMLASSQHHHLQVPNRPRTGSEYPAGFSAVHEPWSGRSATDNFLPAALVSPSLTSAFGSPGLSGSQPMHTVTTTTTTTTYSHQQQQHHPMHIQSPQPHVQQQMTQQQQQLMQPHHSHHHPPPRPHAFPPPSHGVSLLMPPAHQDLSPMPPLPPSMRAPPPATTFGAAVVQLAESIPPPAALNQRRRSLSVPAMLVEMANMRVAQQGEETTQAQNN